MENRHMTPLELEEIHQAEHLVKMLNLKNVEQLPAKRYLLGEGYHTKTALGVYRVVKSIVTGKFCIVGATVLTVILSTTFVHGYECIQEKILPEHTVEQVRTIIHANLDCVRKEIDRRLDIQAAIEKDLAGQSIEAQSEAYRSAVYGNTERKNGLLGPGSRPMGGYQGYSNGNEYNPKQYGNDAYYGYAGGQK